MKRPGNQSEIITGKLPISLDWEIESFPDHVILRIKGLTGSWSLKECETADEAREWLETMGALWQ